MTKAKKKKATGTRKRKSGKGDMGSPSGTHELSDGLAIEGTQVAVQLVEKALHGDASSTEAVADQTAEAAGETQAGASPLGFSQALAWGSEPEWQPESSEEEAETASGGWEPETSSD